jgi:hypothetical protein
VPTDLALAAAAAKGLLHLAERHGGGALVVFVRILRSCIMEMVDPEGYGLEGLDGLDGMGVRKKKKPARERGERDEYLCSTQSALNALNLNMRRIPLRCYVPTVVVKLVSDLQWELPFGCSAISVSRSMLSRIRLTLAEKGSRGSSTQPVQCDSETFQWALTVTITRIGLSRSIAPQSGAAGMSPRVAFLKRSGRTLGPRGAPERRASPSVVITEFPKIICDRTSEVTESVQATLCALSGYNVIFSRWYSR